MSKSIISNEEHCLVCGKTWNLHRHHIFGGHGKRNMSEKYGCWCYLCGDHHDMSDAGVHFNRELDLELKRRCQTVLENEYGWTKEKMIRIFGRNWL